MKIKTIETLKKEGWVFIPEMDLLENENLKMPNGSVAIISLNMFDIFNKLSSEEFAFLKSAFKIANTFLFKNYWWHRDMFEGLPPQCDHFWVDVGFMYPKLICKICDSEKDVQ